MYVSSLFMEKQLKFLNMFLNYIYNSTFVDENGQVWEQRHRVDNISNLKIEIFSNEHPPPHFHIKSPEIDATFSILECKLLNGNIDSKSLKKIEYYHQHMRDKLIEAWNKFRPDDCPVGKIEV